MGKRLLESRPLSCNVALMVPMHWRCRWHMPSQPMEPKTRGPFCARRDPETGRAGKGEVEVLLVHDAAAAAAAPLALPPAQGGAYPVYPYPVPPGMVPVYAVAAPGAPGGVVYQALQMAPGVRHADAHACSGKRLWVTLPSLLWV